MEKRRIVINYQGFAGGTGTLSTQISRYFLGKNIEVFFLYRKVDDLELL